MPVTFQNIFKTSFLEKAAAVPLLDMAVALVLSFLLGLFVFFIYKQCYAGVMYSPSFGVTLVALCLITTLLILTVVSNIVLSLGMVGALSIVRFRTAIKEPMDIAFLFWAIAAGIVLAAGLVFLALFLAFLFVKGRWSRMNEDKWERYFQSISTLGLLVRLGGLLSLAMVLVSILSVPLFQLLGFPAPERLALVLLAAGLTYTLGKLNRDREKLLRKLLRLKPAA